MSDTLPLFISPAQLDAARKRGDVQIVAVDTATDFTAAHVPGALQLDMREIMGARPPTGGLLPDEASLSALFSDIGLRNDAHIVAYDRAGDGQAARLLYTLDAMGHDAISLLDGGLRAWHADGFELARGEPRRGADSGFTVERQPERIADRDRIESRLDAPDQRVLDVRSPAEYAGDDVRSARGGHVPGAINLDWEQLKDTNGRLRPREEIEALLAARDVSPVQEVTAYCQTHVRSSYAYLVLKWLGYERVRGYPGAWSDWGNRDDTPVTTGAAPRE